MGRCGRVLFRVCWCGAFAPGASVVGAYIDLNPVRAGIVSDPKGLSFQRIWEAVGRVLRRITALSGTSWSWGSRAIRIKRVGAEAAAYRRMLFVRGFASGTKSGGAGRGERAAQGCRYAREVSLSLPELLRCRVRYSSQWGVNREPGAFIEMSGQKANTLA